MDIKGDLLNWKTEKSHQHLIKTFFRKTVLEGILHNQELYKNLKSNNNYAEEKLCKAQYFSNNATCIKPQASTLN